MASPVGLIRVAKGAAELPVSITAEWLAREYVTRRPRPATFQQWRLSFQVECEAEAVLVTRVLIAGAGTRFGRTHRSGADRSHTFSLDFRWHEYGSSDLVSIAFTNGNDVSVEGRELGSRPQEFVDVVIPEQPTTGAVVPLARCQAADGIEAQIICIAKSDTVNTHGRWALKPQLQTTLLEQYAFLATGAVSG